MSTQLRFKPQKSPTARPGPADGPRARNRLARTQALCEGALPLFLERGISEVTIADVTEAAGVSKGSFYRYFDDKPHLIRTLFAPFSDGLRDLLNASLRRIENAGSSDALMAEYHAVSGSLVILLTQHGDLAQLHLQERVGTPHPERAPFIELAEEVTEVMIAMTRAAQANGLIGDFDARVSARVVLGAVQELLLAQLRGEDVGSPVEIASNALRFILQGVRG